MSDNTVTFHVDRSLEDSKQQFLKFKQEKTFGFAGLKMNETHAIISCRAPNGSLLVTDTAYSDKQLKDQKEMNNIIVEKALYGAESQTKFKYNTSEAVMDDIDALRQASYKRVNSAKQFTFPVENLTTMDLICSDPTLQKVRTKSLVVKQ